MSPMAIVKLGSLSNCNVGQFRLPFICILVHGDFPDLCLSTKITDIYSFFCENIAFKIPKFCGRK